MRDLAMWAAGGLGIVAAVVHGVLGETHVFATARIEPAWTRRLLRLVWQCGALAWLGSASSSSPRRALGPRRRGSGSGSSAPRSTALPRPRTRGRPAAGISAGWCSPPRPCWRSPARSRGGLDRRPGNARDCRASAGLVQPVRALRALGEIVLARARARPRRRPVRVEALVDDDLDPAVLAHHQDPRSRLPGGA